MCILSILSVKTCIFILHDDTPDQLELLLCIICLNHIQESVSMKCAMVSKTRMKGGNIQDGNVLPAQVIMQPMFSVYFNIARIF